MVPLVQVYAVLGNQVPIAWTYPPTYSQTFPIFIARCSESVVLPDTLTRS
jgi:hypothetical protein